MQRVSAGRDNWYMKKRDDVTGVDGLTAHVDKYIRLLDQSFLEIAEAQEKDLPLLGRTSRAAVLVAGLLENYYTCAETVFVRVSQFFENHLTPDRWHRDLLERMTLQIGTTRPRLLSDGTYRDLLELMRFRHFKRYYFGTAYDWDRLDELLLRVKRTHGALIEELREFRGFLEDL